MHYANAIIDKLNYFLYQLLSFTMTRAINQMQFSIIIIFKTSVSVQLNSQYDNTSYYYNAITLKFQSRKLLKRFIIMDLLCSQHCLE